MALGDRHKHKSERGQALLETAVVLPLILLVCVAIFEFGRVFQTWQVMTNAAREGARLAVIPNETSSTYRIASICICRLDSWRIRRRSS